MKSPLRILIGVGALSALGVLILTYFVLGPSTYEVNGRVAGVDDNGRTVTVEHEEIPGYMPPMIMPLPVEDPSMTASLESGDAIQFELTVSNDSTWISNIQSIPDSSVARNPAQTIRPIDDSGQEGSQPLREGDSVPSDLTLIDQGGTPFQLGDFRGRTLVLTFIYTQCPLPDFCPLMSKHFATLQPILREKYGEQVHLLSVSFDPANDTPAVLRDYADDYTDRLDTWTFATGDTTSVQRAASLFGIYTESEKEEITHNLVTAVIGPNGTIHRLFRGNEWKPDDVVQAVDETL